MKRVVDYCLIRGTSSDDLTKKVKLALTEGWQPIGGPVAVMQKPAHATVIGHIYSQAMIMHYYDLQDPGPM